jgi:short-subunit dehydrogenase
MKTVLITGTSSGIGHAAAVLFATKGYQVLATVRNTNQVDKNLLHKNIRILPLDVTSDESVQNLIDIIYDEYKKIDVLINNAGAGFLGTFEQTTLAQAKEMMDVNFFGVWRVTQAIFPMMRKNKSGHIISISSIGGVIGQPFNDAYCAAKFALEGMMESFAPVASRLGIQVALVEPGPVNSAFVSSVLAKEAASSPELESIYKTMFEAYRENTFNAFAKNSQAPEEIANLLFEIAMTDKPCFRYQTSALANQLAAFKFSDPTGKQTIALSGSRLPVLEEV